MSIRCLIGFHNFKRFGTGINGLSHVEECTRCGCGRFFCFAGHASFNGRLSKQEVAEWKKAAIVPKIGTDRAANFQSLEKRVTP